LEIINLESYFQTPHSEFIAFYITAFIFGLSSSGHCIFMCGGLMSAFQMSTKAEASRHYEIIFHSGRIIAYALLGALLATGLWFFNTENITRFSDVLRLLSGILLILAGLYISGKSQALKYFEKIGEPVWKKLLPIIKKLIPIDNYFKAFTVGLLWAFLPCGLIYSALLVMLATENIISTFFGMLVFGLGTMPALIFSNRLMNIFGSPYFKQFSSVFLIAFGLWILIALMLPMLTISTAHH
jgi:sulfite exporter TauE/SafE